jgi:hypothetical protein
MSLLSTALIAFSLLGATDELPANPRAGGEVAPETRVEPRPAEAPEPHGRLWIGLRLHGPRFQIQGEGTKDRPFLLDLPLGDFFKVRFVMPGVSAPTDGNLYY